MTRNRIIQLATAAAVIAAAGYWFKSGRDGSGGSETVDVAVPDLGPEAERGAELFIANCAACHGENAAGSAKGPPLVHVIYEPDHHADFTFHRAVQQGVRAHHWRFGDMPPVAGVSKAETDRIIAYVRTLQRANGIH